MNGLRARRTSALLGATVGLVALGFGCVDLDVAGPGAVASLRVSPETLSLRVGDSATVRALALDATAALLVQRAASWTSGVPSIASVDVDGKVQALAAGTGSVTANVGTLQATAVVLVSGAPSAIAVSAGNGQSAPVNTAVPIAPEFGRCLADRCSRRERVLLS